MKQKKSSKMILIIQVLLIALEKLSNDRIGLIGVCTHATSDGFQRGLKERPARVMRGIAQLTLGILLTCTGLGLVT